MSWHPRRVNTTTVENTPVESTVDHRDDPNAPVDPTCGFPEDTFACRKYHLEHPQDET